MEIEIKIRLPSEEDTRRLEVAFGDALIASEQQDNVFFDGLNKELISNKLVFRIRVIEKSGKDPVAVVALKGNAILVDGIATVEEEEELIDITVAKQIIDNPNLIPEAAKSHQLLKKIVERVPCKDGYVHMGRFKNLRNKYQWGEYVAEVDRTQFLHGVAYEIEIESVEPEKAKQQLISFLLEHGVPFGDSQRNKFENMIYRTLL